MGCDRRGGLSPAENKADWNIRGQVPRDSWGVKLQLLKFALRKFKQVLYCISARFLLQYTHINVEKQDAESGWVDWGILDD